MSEDERLGPKVRAILQDVIPEPPTGSSLVAGARARVRQRRRRMAAGASLGMAALAAAVIVPTTLLTTGTGRPTSTVSAPPPPPTTAGRPIKPDAEPAWAARCFTSGTSEKGRSPATATPFGRPAPQFVGMSRDAIDKQAAKEHYRVVIVGSDGRCLPVVFDLVAAHHVYLAFDSHDQVVAARDDGFGIRRR